MLTTSPDVDMVTFTGSTPTGRRIMAAASETLKKVFLELGGKSAAIVLDDADFDIAAHVRGVRMVTRTPVRAARSRRGCWCRASTTTRSSSWSRTTSAMVRYGDPADAGTYMGPLISETPARQGRRHGQARRRGRRDAGDRRREGRGPGYFYTPTLLTDVDPDSEIAQDEVFGPVLVVIAYDDDDDAVRIANNSIYGLSGAVFGSQDRALAVARRIRTGTLLDQRRQLLQPRQPVRRLQAVAVSAARWARPGSRSSWRRKTFATVVS